MARTVADCRLLLDIIADQDASHSDQHAYASAAMSPERSRKPGELRIGVLEEGFLLPNMEEGVASSVRRQLSALAASGAVVEPVSVPTHLFGNAVFLAMATQGFEQAVVHGDGCVTGRRDQYDLPLMRLQRRWRDHAEELSPFANALLLLGTYMREQDGLALYGKAINYIPWLRQAYDDVLQRYDAIVMPTLPIVAKPLPEPGAGTLEIFAKSMEMMGNTSQFNVTGHPALTFPSGTVDGLPVGIQLVGKWGGDQTLLDIAAVLEQL